MTPRPPLRHKREPGATVAPGNHTERKMANEITATLAEVRAAIAHYESVQARFGEDDMSPEYDAAIGDVPNYHIRQDGTVIRFGVGGKQEPVRIIG